MKSKILMRPQSALGGVEYLVTECRGVAYVKSREFTSDPFKIQARISMREWNVISGRYGLDDPTRWSPSIAARIIERQRG